RDDLVTGVQTCALPIFGVDLAGDEVPAAIGREQLGHRLPAYRQQLEHQQGGDHTRVRAPEVAEVIVARHLAAEGGAGLTHACLRSEERRVGKEWSAGVV